MLLSLGQSKYSPRENKATPVVPVWHFFLPKNETWPLTSIFIVDLEIPLTWIYSQYRWDHVASVGEQHRSTAKTPLKIHRRILHLPSKNFGEKVGHTSALMRVKLLEKTPKQWFSKGLSWTNRLMPRNPSMLGVGHKQLSKPVKCWPKKRMVWNDCSLGWTQDLYVSVSSGYMCIHLHVSPSSNIMKCNAVRNYLFQQKVFSHWREYKKWKVRWDVKMMNLPLCPWNDIDVLAYHHIELLLGWSLNHQIWKTSSWKTGSSQCDERMNTEVTNTALKPTYLWGSLPPSPSGSPAPGFPKPTSPRFFCSLKVD